jgi:hypothetical protein
MMTNTPRSLLAASVGSFLVGTVAFFVATAAVLGAAHAVTPQESLARDGLIKSAQEAHRSGEHARSLELYQRAAALEATPSLLYWIVWEQQELGQLADAYAGAERCLKELARTPNVRNAAQIRQGCQSLQTQLKDRVGRLAVQVPEPIPEGLTVKLAGRELNRAMIGLPYVLTPGNILVEAEAPGHAPFRLEINVPEGKTINVTVTLAPAPTARVAHGTCPDGHAARPDGSCGPETCEMGMERMDDAGHCCWPGQTWDTALERCAGVARCPPGTQQSGATCVTAVAESTRRGPPPDPSGGADGVGTGLTERRAVKPLALAVGGVGAAALITSGVIWLVSNGRFDELQDECASMLGCTKTGRREKVDDIKRLDGWALGLAIGGAALVGTAALLQWVVPSASDRQAHLTIDPVTRTALLEGRF